VAGEVDTSGSLIPIESSGSEDGSGEVEVDLDALSAESASTTFVPKTDISDLIKSAEEEQKKSPRRAKWFPELLAPEALDGSMAGDVGFDPIGFAKDKKTLIRMRDAEVKHARLAMLAAAGWPMSEIWHKEIAQAFDLPSLLQGGGKAPSLLNGGLSNEWIIGAAAFSVVLGGLLELQAFKAQEKEDYKPGDYGFDPLGLYTFRVSFFLDQMGVEVSREEKLRAAMKDMELCEIKNGRLAMLAISAYAAQEFISGMPIVEQSSFFFGDPIM
jgi:hypothetical protein